jgi:fructose-bisphosphate aldolase class II
VKLTPVILKNSQEHIRAERHTTTNPINFVFHGGSGSTQEEIREAVSYGVVKMNIDTDTQWAFLRPIKKYMDDKAAYLKSQLGNPEGPDKPNKKYIDPRNWLYEGEKGLAARVVEACKDLGSFGQFDF